MKMYINDLKQFALDGKNYLFSSERLKNDVNGNARWSLTVIDTENKAILKRNVKCYEHDLRYYAEEMIKNWK